MPLDTPPAIVQVLTDRGGALGEYAAVTDWARRNGVTFQFVGACASACLWILYQLPREQTCVASGAWIGSHSHLGEKDDYLIWTRGSDLIKQGFRECNKGA